MTIPANGTVWSDGVVKGGLNPKETKIKVGIGKRMAFFSNGRKGMELGERGASGRKTNPRYNGPSGF